MSYISIKLEIRNRDKNQCIDTKYTKHLHFILTQSLTLGFYPSTVTTFCYFFSVLFLFFPCFFFFFLLLSPESAISVFSVYNTVWRIWVLTRVLSHFLLGNWVSSLAAGTGDLKFCLWTGFTLKRIVLNPIQFPFAGLCCEKSQSWIVIRASWVHPSGWHSF